MNKLEEQDSDVSIDNKPYFPKSFYYFKLGMLFYFLCKLKNIKSKDKQFELFNKINEFKSNKNIFDKIYKNIFIDENALIFTYYQQLPSIFIALPSDYIYYKPYITFYKNKYNLNTNLNVDKNFNINELMKNFLTNRIKIQDFRKSKYIEYTLQDQHMFPDPTTIFIPLNKDTYNLIDANENPDTIYILFYDNESYIAKNNGNGIFNLIYKKERLYIKINKDINIKNNFDKLEYLMAMLPITKTDLLNCFDMDILPKDTLLYHSRSDDLTEGVIRTFYALYPTINMINPFGLFNDADYYCFKYKLIEDLKVINLNRDVFYNDLFDEKDNEDEFIGKDTRDNTKIIKSKLFHCIGDNLENRKQCNFNIIKDYKDVKTFSRNKGKRMLILLIAKTSLYWLSIENYYYIEVLSKYNIEAFICHYGKFNNKFLDAELGFCISNDNKEKEKNKYIKYLSMSKGDCSKL